MLSDAEIKSGLAQFYGTEAYHKFSPLHGRLVATDGVAFLVKSAEAVWLLDIIASYQPQCLKDGMLKHIQFWTLTVKDKKAKIVCERDEGKVAFTQVIGHTDFPLEGETKVWVEADECGGQPVMVAMLPEER
jgi:hypothetical protein